MTGEEFCGQEEGSASQQEKHTFPFRGFYGYRAAVQQCSYWNYVSALKFSRQG